MIKRIHNCAVKHFENGSSRIYAKFNDALVAALGLGTTINVSYKRGLIKVVPDLNGSNTIMNTGRGALLELRNKSVRESFEGVLSVSITFRRNKVTISLCYQDKLKLAREQSFIKALIAGDALRVSSFFSGLGMLCWHLKRGFKKAGIKTEIAFALDSCEVAMECNLAANPIWDDAADDAVAVVSTLMELDLSEVPSTHFSEVAIPCINHSAFCDQTKTDLDHPVVGSIYVKLIAALKKANSAVFVIENTPRFLKSKTLDIIKREMTGYRFQEIIINGNAHGDIEGRKRACVLAISDGLPELDLSHFKPQCERVKPTVSDFVSPVSLTSPLWKKMSHVKRKSAETKNNFKNTVYSGEETKIVSLTATYAAPKAGSPMLLHPEDPELQRQFSTEEHGFIRKLPKKLFDSVMSVASGLNPMVSSRGSKSAAHRLMGNGVSEFVWLDMGTFLGVNFTCWKDFGELRPVADFCE